MTDPNTTPGKKRPGQRQNQYSYNTFTQNAQNIQAKPTAYESDVLGGKYLDIKNNPYIKDYTAALSSDHNAQTQLGLSAVRSPFMSGATLGQTGMAAAAGAQYQGAQDRGLTNELAKSYFGLYGDERDRQQGTSSDLSGRTENLVGASASAYGADQDFRGRIQTAKIAAQTELQKAQMAQQMGYDEMAAQYMMNYEQLEQQRINDEREYALRYAGLTGDLLGAFGTETQHSQGPGASVVGSALQGAAGGALGGYGIGTMFGGGNNSYYNNNAAGRYWASNPWGS